MPASKSSQSLVVASLAMLVSAATLWTIKKQQVAGRQNAQAAKVAKAEQGQSQRATALLAQSYRADSQLAYEAIAHSVAFIGGKGVESVASITKAPRHLSIKATSGAMAGSQSGYSERWFWRHKLGEPMQPYAEVTLDADQMAARRFALLEKNYAVTLGAQEFIDGRRAQVLELRPRHSIDGARGPARRLFVDTQSSLTLRIDAFNCALKPISRSSLSKLNLAPQITPITFEAPKAIMASLGNRNWQGEEMAQKHQMAARKTGFLPPRPTFLPPGFELDGYGVHRCLTTGALQLSAFSRYTDGLNTLTVFAFKPSNGNIEKTMRGACNFGPGAMSSREDGAGRLVAVGDLPRKTLERVLAAAKFETVR